MPRGDASAGPAYALLRRLSQRPADWTWAAQTDRQRLAQTATYFLLTTGRDETGPGAFNFLLTGLPRLLQQLSRRTEHELIVLPGRVRGQVVWPATFRARYGAELDVSRFVCREVTHAYDNPENQLLVFLLVRLADCLALVPPAIRGGVLVDLDSGDARAVAPILSQIEMALHAARRHVLLRRVRPPASFEAVHLQRARQARSSDIYRQVAVLAERHRRVVGQFELAQFQALMARQLLLPTTRSRRGGAWLALAAALFESQVEAGEL